MRRVLPLLFSIFLAAPAQAQHSASAARGAVKLPRVVEAGRVSGARIVIDGRLDEPAWASAQPASGFVQFQPEPGAPASHRTVVRVLYDDDAIYVAARMYDAPDSLVARLARRDEQVFSDWFYVMLDSYHDRRTGFAFGVNPRGVKVDLQYSEDVNEDAGWNAVWDVATRVDADGWSAEFRIPLSQLRFSAGRESWGVNFRRQLARRDEISDWSPVPRGGSAFVSAAGELTGLGDLRPRGRLEIQPYALTGLRSAPGEAANPFYRSTQRNGALGADLKWGITSDLTLSATLNPDFGQVEADPSVVNLSGFETFFPERRPFFLEGAEIFRPAFPRFPTIFHSRRIGRAPQGSVPDGAAYADMPDATTILGAAKLTGKTAGGWSLGAFDAVTDAERAPFVGAGDAIGAAPVEPLTNYAVLRVARDLRHGRSVVGVLATATNRALPATGELDFLPAAAYVAGVDGLHRFGGGRYEIAGSLFGSWVRGDTAAIGRIQRGAVHRLNRPDAAAAGYDPARTSLAGYSANAYVTNRNGHWRFYSEGRASSPGFEINDLGYLGRADQISSWTRLWYDPFRPTKAFRTWQINLGTWGNWSFRGERFGTGASTWASAQLHNYWSLAGGLGYDLPRLDPDALRGGPALQANAHFWRWVQITSDPRRSVTLTANGWQDRELGTAGLTTELDIRLELRPSDGLSLSLGPSLTHNLQADQFVSNQVVGSDTHYVRARLSQRTASLTLRAGYTFTPSLSLQLYGQPFVSAGAYGDFGEVSDPKAKVFADRIAPYSAARLTRDSGADEYRVDADGDGSPDFTFANPDFTIREFRSNVVLRWEYRPGSTLFAVWSQGRQLADASGHLRLGRDMADLFSAAGTNVLTLKLSYWLGH